MILNRFRKKKNNQQQKNKDLCDAANRIKNILSSGNYEIKKWINSKNEDALFLCYKDEQPWKGVFIQKIK